MCGDIKKKNADLIGVGAVAPAEWLLLRGNKSGQLRGGLCGRRRWRVQGARVEAARVGLLFLFDALVTENQVYQVFFFPAGVSWDVMEQQVLSQVPDPQTHEPRPLKGGRL